jgi:hypothetical protein
MKMKIDTSMVYDRNYDGTGKHTAQYIPQNIIVINAGHRSNLLTLEVFHNSFAAKVNFADRSSETENSTSEAEHRGGER